MDQLKEGLSKETRARIFAAAEKLHVANGKASFPTVDAVRREAKCSMNDANAGMREWRTEQKKTQVASVAVEVPESVRLSVSTAIAGLWQEAQDLANESLRAAQARWDADKLEIDTLNKEMANDYDKLKAEHETAREELAVLRSGLDEAAQHQAALESKLADTARDLAAAIVASDTATARTIEIERRAAELRTELDHAHQELSQAHSELASVRQAHAVELDALRADMAGLRAKSEEAAARSAEGFQALRAELADFKAKAGEAAQKAGSESDALRTELATVRAKAEAAQEALREQRERSTVEASRAAEQLAAAQAERDEARSVAALAREQTAELRGHMEAVKEQNSKLMQTVKTGAQK